MDIESQPSEFEWLHPSAFIIYQPHRAKSSEVILYNRNSWGILMDPPFHAQSKELSTEDLLAHCERWTTMLEQNISEADATTGGAPESFFIDLFTSGRRKYRVRGFRLYDQSGIAKKKRSYFMFTLERIHRDSVNFQQIFRESKLSRREQDIVHQILAGKCNKEIAEVLGLSINTIKVYLKNLMRKLNVTSKAGIVSFLLLAKPRPLQRRASHTSDTQKK